MPTVAYITLTAVLLIALFLGIRHWRKDRRNRHQAGFLPQTYSSLVPTPSSFEFTSFDTLAAGCAENPTLEAQPGEWRLKMAALGERFSRNHVDFMVFVHGTFLGHDPFDMVRLMRRLVPAIAQTAEGPVKALVERGQGGLLGDVGNFTPEYVRLFGDALGHGIEVVQFNWSSANHHLARFRGSLSLLAELAAAKRDGRLRLFHPIK